MIGDIKAGAAYVEMYLKDSQFAKGLAGAEARLKATGMRLSRAGAAIGVAGLAIIGPIAGAVQEFASVGDQLDKMSARTGVGVEALSALSHAAELSGTNINTVGQAIQKMNRRIGRLTAGQGTMRQAGAAAAVAELGLSLDELSRMNPEQQFFALADAIANYGNQAEAAGLAQRAFGTQVDQLLPLFKGGAAGMREMMAEAKKLGLTMSREDATSAAQLTDAITRATSAMKMGFVRIGAAVSGELTKLAERFAETASHVAKWVDENRALVIQIAKVGAVVAALGAGLAVLGQVSVAVSAGVVAINAALTVLAAHPAVAVVAGLTIGVAALGAALDSATHHTAALSDEMSNIRQRGDEERQTHAALLAELGRLAQKQSLTSTESQRAAGIIETLQENYGDLGVSIDQATGKLTGFAGAQDKVNKGMRAWAKTQIEREIKDRMADMDEMQQELQSLAKSSALRWNMGGEARVTDLTRRAREERRTISQLIERLRRMREGDTAAALGGEKPKAPGGQGAPEATPEEAAAFEQEMMEQIRRQRIEGIQDEKRRAIAAINERYQTEMQRAREVGANQEIVDAKRRQALANVEQEFAARQAEEQKRQAEEQQRYAQDVQREIAQLEIKTGGGTEAEKRAALLELDRIEALGRAPEMGMDTDTINRLFDLKAAAETAQEAPAVTRTAGTFSARVAQYLGLGGSTQDRIAQSNEEIARNTRDLLDKPGLAWAE